MFRLSQTLKFLLINHFQGFALNLKVRYIKNSQNLKILTSIDVIIIDIEPNCIILESLKCV